MQIKVIINPRISYSILFLFPVPLDPGTVEDNAGHNLAYYLEHRNAISMPKWNPKPILFPPTSPKKSVPALKAGAGMERAALSLKKTKEHLEVREGKTLQLKKRLVLYLKSASKISLIFVTDSSHSHSFYVDG